MEVERSEGERKEGRRSIRMILPLNAKPCHYGSLTGCLGLRVARLGTSSVTYEIGIFASDRTADGAGASARASTSGGGAEQASALGQFVHVFVSRDERRPVPIPPRVKEQLERLKVSE